MEYSWYNPVVRKGPENQPWQTATAKIAVPGDGEKYEQQRCSMKRFVFIICSLLLVFLLAGPVFGKDYYRTYDVVEVTEKTIVLQRDKRDTVERIEIERSRRPDIKKGDRVRYDKKRDRLGKTKGKVEPVGGKP